MEVFAAIVSIVVIAFVIWQSKRRDNSPQPPVSAETHEATQEPLQTAQPKEFAFVDLETTGLDPNEDRIIEAAVLFHQEGTTRFNGHSALANPGIEIPDRITELTGITTEMVSGKEPTASVVAKFLDAIGDRPIVAYNAEFDMAFLRMEARRIGRTLQNKSHCLMEYTKQEYPNLRRYRLQDVCAAFCIEAESSIEHGLSPHRAMFDAERAVRLYISMRNGAKPQEVAAQDYIPPSRRLDHSNNAKYHGMRSSAKLLQQDAKDAEATDMERAIHGYRSALKLYIESAKVQIYVAVQQNNTLPLFPESGDIACMNRLALCLCKAGHAEEAKSAMDEYFAAFPKDAELKAAEQVRKRIEKAIAKMDPG